MIWLWIAAAASAQTAPLAQQDRWLHVTSEEDGSEVSVDRQTIVRRPPLVTVWQRKVRAHRLADGTAVSLSRFQYDCEARTVDLLAYVDQDVRGQVTSSHSVASFERQQTPVAPGTVGEDVLTAVCAGQ